MTVAELIEALIDEVYETEVYYGKAENGGWCAHTRKCVKLIG